MLMRPGSPSPLSTTRCAPGVEGAAVLVADASTETPRWPGLQAETTTATPMAPTSDRMGHLPCHDVPRLTPFAGRDSYEVPRRSLAGHPARLRGCDGTGLGGNAPEEHGIAEGEHAT